MPNNLRVAWLLPAFKYYWQPALIEFAKYFPNTTVFTGLFPGFVKGTDLSKININIEIVGKFQPLGNKNKNGYTSAFTYLSPKIIKHLSTLKPDIIFTSSFGVWTIISLLFKYLYGWRVIIAYEGSSPGVDFRNSPLRLFIRRNMIKAADALITNSKRGKEYLTDVLRTPPDLVFTHPYEIPPLELLEVKSGEKKIDLTSFKKPIFLYVGQIIRRKGIDLLLDACISLNRQEKNKYSVLIVGDGPERKSLEAFCHSNNLQDNVKWLGLLEYEKLNDLYLNADVFVFPTREDTWGVVTLEAMLFGNAIICSNGAGSCELIENGENGYIFDINEKDKLYKLMAHLINNASLINEMGINSEQKIRQYNPRSSGKFLKDVLDSCLLKK